MLLYYGLVGLRFQLLNNWIFDLEKVDFLGLVFFLCFFGEFGIDLLFGSVSVSVFFFGCYYWGIDCSVIFNFVVC